MMYKTALALGFALLSTQVVSQSGGTIVNASQYRQIDANGVGNCVFSTMPLGYRDENSAAYGAITTSFVEGQDIHARCYWPNIAAEFQRAGAIFNSIRDEQRYRTSLIWQRVPNNEENPGDMAIVSVRTTYDSDWAMADQQRFDIYDRPDCDFKEMDASRRQMHGFTSVHNCADLASFLRFQIALNERSRSSGDELAGQLPVYTEDGTYRICIQQNVIVADEMSEARRWDDVSNQWRTDREPFRYNLPMARGCFDYRLRA